MLDLKREYEYMKVDIDCAIKRCLEHQKWILGPEVYELENIIAEYLKVKNCIGVSSGTDALVLSLRALALKTKGKEYFDRNDEIITTPFTFTATGDAILRSGATPVFVDINPTTFNINPVKIREYLRSPSSGRVAGILPVHIFGQSCQMDEIIEIAEEYNLFVLEDVAQAFGGKWKGEKLGSLGNAGAFSFFPSKNLGGFGDGGMVATNNDDIASYVRILLKHGGKDKYNVDHIGYNARLDTIQAAIILAKIKYIDEFNERRRQIAELYTNGLKNINALDLQSIYKSSTKDDLFHVYHQYTIRLKEGKRDDLQRYLKDNAVSTMVHYPLSLHKMGVFDGVMKIHSDLKNAEELTEEVLSLPIEPLQKEKDTEYVVKLIKKYFQEKDNHKKDG